MRIDPNGLIGGCPALVVRKALRHLRVWDEWGVAELEAAAALAPGTGDALVKALRTEGLIEASARGAALWALEQTSVIPSISAVETSMAATFHPRPAAQAAFDKMAEDRLRLFERLYGK